jgi:hypothetical protein
MLIAVCFITLMNFNWGMVRTDHKARHVNGNYRLSNEPYGLCVNDDYVFVIDNSWMRLFYRSNFTLKTNVSTIGDFQIYPGLRGARCDNDFVYVHGKTQNFGDGSAAGWNITKYSLPNLSWVASYDNTSWDFPEYICLDDTYLYAGGAKSTSVSGLIKLWKSNLTEACPTTGHNYNDLDYNYRLALSPNGQWLYTSIGCKLETGRIGKYYASNITYVDDFIVASGEYHNMQNIIALSNDLIIVSEAPLDNGLVSCVNASLDLQWNLSIDNSPADEVYRMRYYNSTHFFTGEGNGGVYCRFVSNGSVDWSYDGFDNGYLRFWPYGRFLYICAYDTDDWYLRNVTIESAAAGSTPS